MHLPILLSPYSNGLSVTRVGLVLAMLLATGVPVTASDRPAAQIKIDNAVERRCLKILRDGMRSEQSDEFWPSIHAAEGLILAGYGDEVRSPLEARLREETDDQRRCGIARELVRAGDSSKIQILADLLAGEDDYAHVHAAEGLFKIAEIGDHDVMLRAFASDENVSLHLMAAGALARQGHPDALEAIRATYTTGDGNEMRIAAWLLGRVRILEPTPPLLRKTPAPYRWCRS